MKDELILRLMQDTCKKLDSVSLDLMEMPDVARTYGALLAAVHANHPDEPYLNTLAGSELTLTGDASSAAVLKILFGQLRIVLEALVEEKAG